MFRSTIDAAVVRLVAALQVLREAPPDSLVSQPMPSASPGGQSMSLLSMLRKTEPMGAPAIDPLWPAGLESEASGS